MWTIAIFGALLNRPNKSTNDARHLRGYVMNRLATVKVNRRQPRTEVKLCLRAFLNSLRVIVAEDIATLIIAA